MRLTRFVAVLIGVVAVLGPAAAQDAMPPGAPAEPPLLTAAAVNAASLDDVPPQYLGDAPLVVGEAPPATTPQPAIARLQVLLDRAGASPGVIDGFDGDNVRKAIVALELMHGLPADGRIDAEVLALLDAGHQAIGTYAITARDTEEVTGPVPEDYGEKAEMQFLGYADVAEAVAEKFHMDIDLLHALNPGARFVPGETVHVADVGQERGGAAARIEADKALRQVRAYAADGTLLAAYPATIGSADNPSPSGTHRVAGVAPMPVYTYNPAINFQQGGNTEVLEIPPGPNGPVGSMWIDLSEPTYGIHGTPEPSLIDKTASHGCVRLTNWDAGELSRMVRPGVTVDFVG